MRGVSRRRQRISSSMEFSMSIETDPGVADTIATITCPLPTVPFCFYYHTLAR